MSFCPHVRSLLAPLAALALLALGGCVVAPAYGPGGYHAPAPVVVGGWYGGGGGGWYRGRGW